MPLALPIGRLPIGPAVGTHKFFAASTIATAIAINPWYWGWNLQTLNASIATGEEAGISVPVLRPASQEMAWVMASESHHFTQVGWVWLGGAPAPQLFALTDAAGHTWQGTGRSWGQWGPGRWYMGPVVHRFVRVRIVEEGGKYLDQAQVGPSWVTVQSVEMAPGPEWSAELESEAPSVPQNVCISRSLLVGGTWRVSSGQGLGLPSLSDGWACMGARATAGPSVP